LQQLVAELAMAVGEMQKWPVLRWLYPASTVRLSYLDRNSQNYSIDALGRHRITAAAYKFQAVLLDESIVLWQTLGLPSLSQQERMAALQIQAQARSPFGPDDTAWGYTSPVPNPATGGLTVHLAIVSRKQAQSAASKYAVAADAAGTVPEWWAKAPGTEQMVVFDSPSVLLRVQKSRKWQMLNQFLLLTLLALLLAAAITPTLQLRLQAQQAAASYSALATAAANGLHQREQLVKLQQQAQMLQAQLKGSVSPELALMRVTQLLPDNTYLSSLQIQGDKVVINGLTPNTATLMQQLGTQPGVQAVRAPVPATKQRGADRETFSIEFKLDPAALGGAL
jgi:general secretion pathway protein L